MFSWYGNLVVGFVQGSGSVGWALAVILAALILTVAPQNYDWRLLFLVGILPALMTFLVRRHVDEPEAFGHAQQSQAVGPAPSTFVIFGPHRDPQGQRQTLRFAMIAAGRCRILRRYGLQGR